MVRLKSNIYKTLTLLSLMLAAPLMQATYANSRNPISGKTEVTLPPAVTTETPTKKSARKAASSKSLSLEAVYALATKHSSSIFPQVADLLAIAWIESNYNPLARNGVSNGLMQVNHGSFDPDKSMERASEMLQDLKKRLGSVKASIIAYNCGIGNYLKGNYRLEYWYKYQKEKERLATKLAALQPSTVDQGADDGHNIMDNFDDRERDPVTDNTGNPVSTIPQGNS